MAMKLYFYSSYRENLKKSNNEILFLSNTNDKSYKGLDKMSMKLAKCWKKPIKQGRGAGLRKKVFIQLSKTSQNIQAFCFCQFSEYYCSSSNKFNIFLKTFSKIENDVFWDFHWQILSFFIAELFYQSSILFFQFIFQVHYFHQGN
jgi:hypothetical protein